MNKKELFESISHLPSDCSGPRPMIDKLITLELIKLLDETQEVEIPMFMADFITEQKKLGHTLSYSIDACMPDRVEEWYWDNSELFALAWIFGYKVKKEKRYRVKMKGMDKDFTMLKLDEIKGGWYLGSDTEFSYTKNTHTRKELEEAGFDEVFNSPLFEVEEVEE